MVWQYDTYACQDMLSHEKNLEKLSKVLVSRLARFNFYTRVNVGDRRLVTNKISHYDVVKIDDDYGNPSLKLTVNLQIKNPVDISSINTIKINHTDPTKKALLFYEKDEDLVFENELKPICKAIVEEKLEFNDGEFPQIVTINCNPSVG